jgi:hypothetical protein
MPSNTVAESARNPISRNRVARHKKVQFNSSRHCSGKGGGGKQKMDYNKLKYVCTYAGQECEVFAIAIFVK